ncbi:uncharacterized protein BP01DRAFT_31301 [Aspergillus saccharolyticus JOP 1030-1]|uniref:Uncharacterized protein n=1 Tax=Aspergillus saccharolyticus JOP 1030-1 TaxID=1450539 RepID=A0A319A0Q5_9EURO|nr:hypothetical protein BP01DRAFT_31301 [Aspergillus saccharolyticus JOP 1030-1]PYH45868.1 hypothetical protein BP01DRAFT_31301 [Aspergillus saccharolyticus JOP 1030-1]
MLHTLEDSIECLHTLVYNPSRDISRIHPGMKAKDESGEKIPNAMTTAADPIGADLWGVNRLSIGLVSAMGPSPSLLQFYSVVTPYSALCFQLPLRREFRFLLVEISRRRPTMQCILGSYVYLSRALVLLTQVPPLDCVVLSVYRIFRGKSKQIRLCQN